MIGICEIKKYLVVTFIGSSWPQNLTSKDMNWKIKAKIQTIIAMLPSSISYRLYYLIQRKVGRLQEFDILPIIKGGINTFKLIYEAGYNPQEKVFFEVGTGRAPIVPITYWLMGAKQIITIDLNPYIKEELLEEILHYIVENEKEMQNLFGDLLDAERMVKLSEYLRNNTVELDSFLDLCCIKYMAPGDATDTEIESNSIDFHTSFTVYEHIPHDVLVLILKEGNRIIKENGLFINSIDYFDHFMHFDDKISSINFLQYSDSRWKKYADNKYMYMNRMRHDDFLELFHKSNHQIVIEKTDLDDKALKLLESGSLKLDSRFINKTNEVNCIASSWFITKAMH